VSKDFEERRIFFGLSALGRQRLPAVRALLIGDASTAGRQRIFNF